MGKYTNAEIIKGILERRNQVFIFLYKEYLPMIKNLIIKNKGSESEAQDLFQDTIIIVFSKINSGNLKLSSSFKTYFYAIAKYLWYQRLELLKKISLRDDDDGIWDRPIEHDEYLDFEEEKLYQTHFKNLDENCQKILQGYFEKKSFKEIANDLQFTPNYIKKLKFNCKEKLYRSIINDPVYMELMEIKKEIGLNRKPNSKRTNLQNRVLKNKENPENHENKKRNK